MKTNLLGIFILFLFNNPITAFEAGWTQNLGLSDDGTHYSISECALYRITYDYLKKLNPELNTSAPLTENGRCLNAINLIKEAITKSSLNFNSYKRAIEEIIETNRAVDMAEISQAEAHFNDDKFNEAAERIRSFKSIAISTTDYNQYETSRKIFGRLLHTLQDFYSHSNWVEIYPNRVNPALGYQTNLGVLIPNTVIACFPCNTTESCRSNINDFVIRNRLLTSGYFSLNPLSVQVPNKCNHGGKLNLTRNSFEGINKDTLQSVHGHLHTKAAHLAEISSYDILKDYWTAIGDEKFGMFLGFRGYSFIITLDTTGSMSGEIAAAKAIAINLTQSYATDPSPPLNYILSPFNDPYWGPLTITKDPAVFSNAVSILTANGGGDEPELFYSGLLDALTAGEPNSVAFTFTDASAKDRHLAGECLSIAKKKNIKITPVLTSNSVMRFASSKITPDAIAEYSQLAALTGGQALLFNKNSMADVPKLILKQRNQDAIQLLLVGQYVINDHYFYVDASISSLNFYLSSLNSVINFILYDPQNQTSHVFDWDYNLSYSKSFNLDNPAKGMWRIRITSASTSIKITGVSNLAILSNINKFNDNPNHAGYVRVEGSLLRDTNLTILSTIQNSDALISSVSIDLLNENLLLILSLKPNQQGNTNVLTNFRVPSSSFRVRVTVQQQDGAIIQRFQPELFTTSALNVQLTAKDNENVMIQGEYFEVIFRVWNDGTSVMTVECELQDSLKFITYNKEVTLSANSVYNDTVKFLVKNMTNTSVSIDVITLTARIKYSTIFENTNFVSLSIPVFNETIDFTAGPTFEPILIDETTTNIITTTEETTTTEKTTTTVSDVSQTSTFKSTAVKNRFSKETVWIIIGSVAGFLVLVTTFVAVYWICGLKKNKVQVKL